jgi:sec-independent protein translocase protein TatC
MPLTEHLRELRNRLLISVIAIGVGATIGWITYDRIFAVIRRPFDEYRATALANGRTVELTLNGITSAFTLKLDVALFVGIVLATPVWTYQLWAFLRPGLHRRERRYTIGFVLAATPLFLAGIALGYLVLPNAIDILLGLTPIGVANLPTVGEYLSFVLRLALAFGIAFLMPVVVVALNFAGVLSAERLRSWWRGAVLGVFVFSAVITPTPDPWNMTLLALPMLLLLLIAWGIAWWNDRRKRRRRASEGWDQLADDEASALDTTPSPVDDIT